MKRLMVFAAALSLFVQNAQAKNSPELAALAQGQVETWVSGLSRCAGVYEVAARLNDGDQPATAKTWRDTARGARFAALYLLRLERVRWQNEARALEDFADLVDPQIDISRSQLQALVEHNQADSVMAEMKRCVALREIQNELVDLMRDELDVR